jgi:hypothetical protein
MGLSFWLSRVESSWGGGEVYVIFRVYAFERMLIVGFDHLVLLRRLRTLPRKTRNRRIGQPRKGLIHRRRMFLHRETDTCWEVIVVCGGIGLAGLIVLETVVC